jgi:hypothetical protein
LLNQIRKRASISLKHVEKEPEAAAAPTGSHDDLLEAIRHRPSLRHVEKPSGQKKLKRQPTNNLARALKEQMAARNKALGARDGDDDDDDDDDDDEWK